MTTTTTTKLLSALLICISAIGMASAAADVAAAAHPGCQTRCGDVDIPFPFGIGDKCAIHEGFQLKCKAPKQDSKLMKPFRGDFEVTKISVEDGKAWVKAYMSSQCYDPFTGGMSYSDASANFSGSVFWLSDTDNRITIIGCQTLAYMMSDSYVIGCSSTCDDNDQTPNNGSCSGAGCCQASVPKRIQYYRGYFNEDYNTSKIWRNSPCSYMVVMEDASFNFSTTYLTSRVFNETYKGEVPVVLDWAITPDTCKEPQRNKTSYACVSNNSHCIDNMNAQGYRCQCSNGFEGNPYVKDGCKDIDECLHSPCSEICTNTLGNFTCSCYPGRYMMNGVCVPNKKIGFASVPAVVGASVIFVVLVVTMMFAYLIKERRKLRHIKQHYLRQHGGLLLFEEMKSQEGVAFKIFSHEELQEATNRFSEQQILGQGGHGTVYKGLLKGNTEVAVKRCMTINEQQKKEFGKEMLILSQINHKNIVKLLGCCLEVEVPMLVYEFIPNGTLFDLIHGDHGQQISLATRLRIAHESAEAITYLHSCASPPILHGDIKSSNILLDRNLIAKISDFGASILAPTDESQFVTLVQGTCGYLDPEYMQLCQLTDKSDVYNFGVVLVELLTCQKAFNLNAPEHEKSLSMRFLNAMKNNKLAHIIDGQIKNRENMPFLEEIAELAGQCLEMSGVNRPPMKQVADNLDRLRKVMQHPWVEQNSEELESLLGESSRVSSRGTSTANFSIERRGVMELDSGR
uniref:Protein kinase domain-containing protein n=1 Tax=Leersia perrieri TaxID=77586 RepID=A0A0D9XEQ2_9ORYZ